MRLPCVRPQGEDAHRGRTAAVGSREKHCLSSPLLATFQGGGFMMPLTRNWRIGFELRETEFGKWDVTQGNPALYQGKFEFDRLHDFSAMARVNYNFTMSDARVKRDVELVARLDDGLGLYRYRYLWSDQFYVGVIAQEVTLTKRDAVVQGEDGYLRVDYALLGLRLQTWEDWKAAH
jgi:hypothetical protein